MSVNLFKLFNFCSFSRTNHLRLLLKPCPGSKFHQCLSTEIIKSEETNNEVVTNEEQTNDVGVPEPEKRVMRKKPYKFMLDSKSVEPSHTSIILFPGQGSQFVGMGHDMLDIPSVQKMFETAESILGYDLLELCLNGPSDELNETIHCQPAIYVTSLGAVEKLRVTHPGVVEACVGTAGFSVGELAALVFAGAFSFEAGLRLVKIRAEAMQKAAQHVPGGLMTIKFGPDARLSLACRAAVEWCISRGIDQEHAVCSIANHLFPHCKVIGGHEEALKFLEINAREFGIKLTKRLKVSGAFHTQLMRPAKKVFKEALFKTPFNELLIPCYSNVDAQVYRFEKQIHQKLPEQIYKAVKWEQVMCQIYRRPEDFQFPKTFECGPGNNLLSILKNCNFKAYQQAKSII
ncbi:probable malonyl-CoA-acyl carrier protein transacylase, mitochondrial [Tetranychus urticae]|uniref:probable malonyl-CoA-acyl carrier protein transacylase, mitochondrial n=1 Tax=Tetranychus urticae TaxID=32264 RepID=UPI00077BCC85|nr:probable malonyl-CoA-acyl carrier protein transacylase, mitochondrial [Tetranychus urticae]